MQNAPRAILSTLIKLSFVIQIFDLPIYEWPFYTGFTVFSFAFNHKFVYSDAHNRLLFSVFTSAQLRIDLSCCLRKVFDHHQKCIQSCNSTT